MLLDPIYLILEVLESPSLVVWGAAQGRFQGGRGGGPSEIYAPPPVAPKQFKIRPPLAEFFLHYILTNEFACLYVFII